jgi:hypothetical protein
MERNLSARTLDAIQGSSDALSGRLFSRMHPFSQEMVELQSLLLAFALNQQGLPETDC